MIRIAAVADIHLGEDSGDELRPLLGDIDEHADILLVAGDLTRHGTAREAAVAAAELEGLPVPVVGILGNHDHHSDEENKVLEVMRDAGVTMLDGETATYSIRGKTLGIAGVKGFGGGFAGACGSDFGEPQMKAFVQHTRWHAERLEDALGSLETDHKVALIHYAPVEATLEGERLEIYPFLGSYLLADAIDRAGADVIFHGHAHAGREAGETLGGIPVRNVAHAIIGVPYRVFTLGAGDDPS